MPADASAAKSRETELETKSRRADPRLSADSIETLLERVDEDDRGARCVGLERPRDDHSDVPIGDLPDEEPPGIQRRFFFDPRASSRRSSK